MSTTSFSSRLDSACIVCDVSRIRRYLIEVLVYHWTAYVCSSSGSSLRDAVKLPGGAMYCQRQVEISKFHLRQSIPIGPHIGFWRSKRATVSGWKDEMSFRTERSHRCPAFRLAVTCQAVKNTITTSPHQSAAHTTPPTPRTRNQAYRFENVWLGIIETGTRLHPYRSAQPGTAGSMLEGPGRVFLVSGQIRGAGDWDRGGELQEGAGGV